MYLWASLIVQLVKNPPAVQETRFNSWVGKIHWSKDRYIYIIYILCIYTHTHPYIQIYIHALIIPQYTSIHKISMVELISF